MRLSERKGEQLIRHLKKRHRDMTVEETIPNAAKQFDQLLKDHARIKKRVSALETTVEKLWADKILREMKDDNIPGT